MVLLDGGAVTWEPGADRVVSLKPFSNDVELELTCPWGEATIVKAAHKVRKRG